MKLHDKNDCQVDFYWAGFLMGQSIKICWKRQGKKGPRGRKQGPSNVSRKYDFDEQLVKVFHYVETNIACIRNLSSPGGSHTWLGSPKHYQKLNHY